MKYKAVQEDNYWSLYLGDAVLVRRESFTIVDGLCDILNGVRPYRQDELCEAALVIADAQERIRL
jgi:hypothetical protein